MEGTLRGDGLARSALQPLPAVLQIKSIPQLNPLRRPSPPDSAQRERDVRQDRLQKEHQASWPHDQFAAQTSEELDRMIKGIVQVPDGASFHEEAHNNVKKLWVEQGIWNDNWGRFMEGRWKHEEPLVNGDWESETDEEAKAEEKAEPDPPPAASTEPDPGPARISGDSESDARNATQQRDRYYLFGSLGREPPAVPRNQNTDGPDSLFGSIPIYLPPPQPPRKQESPRQIERRQRRAERRAKLEREREASRPFHQFVFQVSKERERIQRETGNDGELTTIAARDADINTRAYDNVKNIWIRRMIWNNKWGILPGMTWKHEESIEWLSADLPPVEANQLQTEDDRNGAGEAHSDGPKLPSHSETNFRELSNIDNASHPGQLSLDAPRSTNGSTERLPEPTTPQRRWGRGVPDTSAPGPAHPPKVSKPPAKKRGRPRRLRNLLEGESATTSSSFLPEPTADDSSKALTTPPRRSKRLRTAVEPSASDDTTGMAPTNLPNAAARSRPRRTATNSTKPVSSAKPQGIVKKQSSRTTSKLEKRN
ncbi:hypothetical protein AJ79_06782 [Helicocarpus griseus UAMH5409]|uniref:Uncharacterized protein n=1 Tax=Helicocarpus griseus UAMH5409 TaxID=1447875 RepID=A0A2B7X934_9EURO|nr:hypothetical protein AJ79_06782 [Helicocarpus griseus UAMH5409]